ncbi:MAG: class I SAM-dependent methyltransferase [Nitrosopumilus sp.]
MVEVGVFQGKNAEHILQLNQRVKLILVDSWKPYPDMSQNWVRAKGITYSRFRGNRRVKIIEKKSVEAAIDVLDQSVDLVFLDAAHDYNSVCNDIHAWLPKIKVGGWIGGHDYGDPRWKVHLAVQEFFASYDLSTDLTWWVKC